MRISDWSSDVCSSDLFGEQPRLGRAVDRAVHAATAEQRFVGGIGDRVVRERGDVVFNDLDAHRRAGLFQPSDASHALSAPSYTPSSRNVARQRSPASCSLARITSPSFASFDTSSYAATVEPAAMQQHMPYFTH